MGSLIKRDRLVSAHELKRRDNIFLHVLAEIGRHWGQALEEKFNIKDKVRGGLLRLEVLPQDLYDAGGISGMRFLVDSLRGEALDEFAVELFGEKDDGLDDGLFHSLDVLG